MQRILRHADRSSTALGGLMIIVTVYGNYCTHETDAKGSEDLFEEKLKALFPNAPAPSITFVERVRNHLPGGENFRTEVFIRGSVDPNSSRRFFTSFEATPIAQKIARYTDGVFYCHRCPEQRSTYCVLIPPGNRDPIIASTVKKKEPKTTKARKPRKDKKKKQKLRKKRI